jgi:hypothetical protein
MNWRRNFAIGMKKMNSHETAAPTNNGITINIETIIHTVIFCERLNLS